MTHLEVTERFVETTSGPKVRIVEAGEGPTCVFLPGLLGVVAHYEETLALLQQRARCLVFDPNLLELPREFCNLDAVTKAINEVISREELGPATLIGNSFGGHVALLTALERPELVRGLVLAGSSGLAERTYEKDVQHRPSKPWLRRKIGEIFSDPDYNVEEFVEHAYRELTNPRKALAMVKLGRSTKQRHLGHLLPKITAPTLVLWGEDDEITNGEAARQFTRLIPDSRLKWIPDCGHAPMLERPAAFAAGIEAFLDHLDQVDQEDAAA
ncbi:MAG: alpha/beta fold hydrolase [Phycisphaerales bacterium JB038]